MGKAILDIDDADEDFYKGVTEALSVYNSIEQNPGITTCKLSAELKLPEKSETMKRVYWYLIRKRNIDRVNDGI